MRPLDLSLRTTTRAQSATSSERVRPLSAAAGLVLVFLAVAFLVRLTDAGTRAIWQDEGLTLYQVRQSIPFVLSGVIEVQGLPTQNTHPPFYFLLLTLFTRLVGVSEFTTRWFSVAWSLVGVTIFYALGRRLAGWRVGVLAAGMAALSPLYLWYAQEIRMYTMLVALSALSLYTLWRAAVAVAAQSSLSRRLLLAYLVATGLMLWTHYSAFFVLPVHGLVWLALLARRRPKAVLLVGGGLFLASLPLLPFAWHRLRTGVERDFHFVPLGIILRDLLNGFTGGISIQLSEIWWLDLLMLAVLLLGLLWLFRRGQAGIALLLGAVLLVPPVALFVLSFIKPLYQGVRHLIVISPAYYVLAAAGLVGIARGLEAPLRRPRRLGQVAAAVVGLLWVVVALRSTANYFTDPRYFKEDFEGMFAYIEAHFRPGDIVVLNDAVLSHVLEYYEPGLPWTALPRYGTSAEDERAEADFEAVARAHPRVWLVYLPGDSLADPDRRVKRWFDKNAFRIDDRKFRGMSIAVAVAYYDTAGVETHSPQPVEQPLDVQYQDGLDLVGVAVPERTVVAGRPLFYDLVWRVREQPAADYGVSGRLLDSQGVIWALDDQRPYRGVHHQTSHWVGGRWLRVPLELRVPPGTPPGDYTFVILPYDLVTGRPLGRVDGQDPAVQLGTITVEPGPRPDDWEAPLPLEARFGESLRLVGGDLPGSARVGATVPARLYFEVLSRLPSGLGVRLELLGKGGTTAWSQTGPLLGLTNVDTETLPPETLVAGRYQVDLPPTLPPGVYSLRAAILDTAGTPIPTRAWWPFGMNPWVEVAKITVEDRPRSFDVPALATPLDVEWSQGVRLRGAEWPATAQAGESATVRLAWQAGNPTDRSYKVFVHLRDEANRIVAQHDALPAGGGAPTNTWATAEVVVDEHTLVLPADLEPGRYRLVVGFYHEESGERLPLSEGAENESVLGTLEVVRGQ